MRHSLVGRAVAGAALAVSAAGCGVSTQQEVQMGAEYASQINQQLPIVTDALVNQYINTLGNEIARRADDRGLEWHFYVVNSPEVNAFAVPGGYIYVNRGLIERATRMDQVAGVLGHEIGHVTKRHSVKQMGQQQGAQIGVTLACILQPSVCNSQVGSAAINLGANAVFAKFSRDDEREADQVGIEYVTKAGIDPRGIPEMFQILLNERQSGRSGVEAWFATHPLEEDRIRDTQASIAQYNVAQLNQLTKQTNNFINFQQRLRSLPAAPQRAAR
jgi:beta-barrel assembly-enhancing protease